MNNDTQKEIEEDEEYLDEKFPKGKTKFRGEAMVLLALARRVGKSQALADVKCSICGKNWSR